MTKGYLILLSLIFYLSVISTGCNQISLKGQNRHGLIRNSTQQSAALIERNIDLSGQWRIGFRCRDKVVTGLMFLKQNGQSFSGYGKENETGNTFKINHGEIKDNEVIFLKYYDNDPRIPLQCHGQFSRLSGENNATPYMGGEFSREISGNLINGDWEAGLNLPEQSPAIRMSLKESKTIEGPQKEPQKPSEHIPDLSGKWAMAFEYNFKIMHATIFLEQEGNRLTGHGLDKNTGARFIIKKGWYSYPAVSFICEYSANKKQNSFYPEHEMIFKADVTIVNDNDYQGPYLSGKTKGGGNWEAERIN